LFPKGNILKAQLIRWDEDEDKNLARVGILAREKPIFLLIETLGHRHVGRFGAHRVQVRERRLSNRPSHGRRGENLREMKTQERIGSNRRGKTGRMDARILTRLKPLKASLPRTVAGNQKEGRQTFF
jgi:hypothetical protein